MLHFDIDWSGLNDIGDQLGATEKQVKFALSRSLRRTEASLRRLSSKGLSDALQLRAMSSLRKRLKSIRIKAPTNGDSATLWYGLNDLPVSSFKGRPYQTDTGADFKGKSYPGAFVAHSRIKGKRTIFKREGKSRLHIREQLYPIEDKAIVYIEDEVFNKTEAIFWAHFKRDLTARIKYKLGEA